MTTTMTRKATTPSARPAIKGPNAPDAPSRGHGAPVASVPAARTSSTLGWVQDIVGAAARQVVRDPFGSAMRMTTAYLALAARATQAHPTSSLGGSTPVLTAFGGRPRPADSGSTIWATLPPRRDSVPQTAVSTPGSLRGRKLLVDFSAPNWAQPIRGPEGADFGIASGGSDAENKRITSAKTTIAENIGDPEIRTLAVAVAGAESKFDLNEVINDQNRNGKKDTDLEECSILRINVGMMKLLKVAKEDIDKIKGGDLQRACRVFETACKRFGRFGFLLFHRGGKGAYDNHNKNPSQPLDWSDQIYLDRLSRCQRSIESDKSFMTDNRWPWAQIPPK